MISILVVLTLFKGSFGSHVPFVGLYQQFPTHPGGPSGTGGIDLRTVGSGQGTRPELVLSGQDSSSSSQGTSQGSQGTFNRGTLVPNNVNFHGTSSHSNRNLDFVFSNRGQPAPEQESIATETLPFQGPFFPGFPSDQGDVFLPVVPPASSTGNFQVIQGSAPEPPVVQAVNVNEDDSSSEAEIISFTTFTDTVTVSHTIVTGTTVLEPDYTTTTELVTFATTRTSRVYVPDDATTNIFTLTSTITNFQIQTTTTETDSTWETSTTTTDILISTTPREYDLKLTKIVTTFKIVPIIKYTTISLTEVLTVKVPATTTVYSAASKLVTRAY
ncbi:uncharacterized protein LOC143035509 [Oratosquilla oratoria]|uniref:uncharacterized protein LOC143035509 n=1 Tax=Oratosquilla oratoria TaxID=337810 RepID=UPI003F766988